MNFSSILKSYLESAFSMPFDIKSKVEDGETHYVCSPQNDEQAYFEVKAYVHSSIRLILEIYPQKHGGYILYDMASASEEKRNLFLGYWQLMLDDGAKVKFSVNNYPLSPGDLWPNQWRSFHCKISKIPIPDTEDAEFTSIRDWMELSFSMFFSLLNIVDIESNEFLPIQTEGTPQEIRSIRYERNQFNRKLCLLQKGYSCAVCGLNFQEAYGPLGKDFIEVHHTMPVSKMGPDYVLDINRDLTPLCSNCHSMVHRVTPPMELDELRKFFRDYSLGASVTAAEPLVPYKSSAENNLIVGVVKPGQVATYINRSARSYYFGKRFPSTFNLKGIQYFAPYFNGGITGYYDVLGIRTAKRSELDSQSLPDPNDIRIVLDLGDYHHLFDKPKKLKLIYHSYAFIKLNDYTRDQ